MRQRGWRRGGWGRAAAAVALAVIAGHAGAAPAAPAPPPQPVAVLAVMVDGRPAAAVRVAQETVLIAAAADKGAAVTLGGPPAPVPAPTPTPARGPAPVPVTVAPGPAGRVIAHGDGFGVVRFAAAALDAAGAQTVPLTATAMDFDDPLTLTGPGVARDAAVLEGAQIVPFWPRAAVQTSGLRPAGGGILLNGCGQVAGIVGRDGADGYALAATRSAIAAALSAADRAVSGPAPTCDVRGHGIDRLIDRARANAAALRAQAAGLDAQAAQLLASHPPAAPARAATLRTQAATYRQTASDDLASADQLTTFQQTHRRNLVVVVIGLVLLLLIAVIGALFWRRNRILAGAHAREQARLDSEAAAIARRLDVAPWRNVVLEGGHEYLKVPGDLLGEGGAGAIIGRSATQARVMLSARDVGRAHARLFVEGDRLWVEDLGSVNGTSLNGTRLPQGNPAPVAQGDEVAFAAHRFRVRIQ